MKKYEYPLLRPEYDDKVRELCESGNIPEEYRTTVWYAFFNVKKPEDEIFLKVWNRYRRSKKLFRN
jgi:hypothetical protein